MSKNNNNNNNNNNVKKVVNTDHMKPSNKRDYTLGEIADRAIIVVTEYMEVEGSIELESKAIRCLAKHKIDDEHRSLVVTLDNSIRQIVEWSTLKDTEETNSVDGANATAVLDAMDRLGISIKKDGVDYSFDNFDVATGTVILQAILSYMKGNLL